MWQSLLHSLQLACVHTLSVSPIQSDHLYFYYQSFAKYKVSYTTKASMGTGLYTDKWKHSLLYLLYCLDTYHCDLPTRGLRGSGLLSVASSASSTPASSSCCDRHSMLGLMPWLAIHLATTSGSTPARQPHRYLYANLGSDCARSLSIIYSQF